MEKVLIPFALVNNKVKNIKDISKLDEAYCLECGEKLILKNGDKNIKHLAHKSNSNCVYKNEIEYKNKSTESYQHKYAKEYLKDNLVYFRQYLNQIIVKDGEFKLGGYSDLSINDIKVEYRELKKYLNLKYDYIPDLLIETKGKLIALEIYKTNKKEYSVLKENLLNKNIDVYEVDINNIKELNIDSIFKNMKLVYSDLKVEFNEAISPFQECIVENKKLKNAINVKDRELERLKDELDEVRMKRYDLLDEIKELKEEKRINKLQMKSIERKLRSKITKENIEKDKISIKCRSNCVKVWYSNKLNSLLEKDISRCMKDSEEYNLLIRFKMFFNGKVGAYTTYGGDEKLKEIAFIVREYENSIKYLGVDNEQFELNLKMKTYEDKGEKILREVFPNEILDIRS